jgi:hypothetical protein
MVQVEPEIAFCHVDAAAPGLEVLVNFGIYAGREATAAEIDELARLLRPELGEVSIVSETRHEIGRAVEAEVHQVRIEVTAAALPADEDGRDEFSGRIVETASFWARMCAAERHAESLN